MSNIFRAPKEGLSAMLANIARIEQKGNQYFIASDPWQGYETGTAVKINALPEGTKIKDSPTFYLTYNIERDNVDYISLSQMEQDQNDDFKSGDIPRVDKSNILNTLDELTLAYIQIGSESTQTGQDEDYYSFMLFRIERPKDVLIRAYRNILDFEKKEITRHTKLRNQYVKKIATLT